MILVCICKNYYKVWYSDLATELYFYGKSVLTVCQPNFAVELWYYIALQIILGDLINNGRIYKVFVHANGNSYTIMQWSLCRYSPIIKELPFLIILGYTVIYTIIKKKIHTIVEKKPKQRPHLRWLYGRGHFETISFSFRNMQSFILRYRQIFQIQRFTI